MPWAIGASIVGGLLNRNAAKRAGKADSRAIAEQRRQFDLVRGDTAPYREVGQENLNLLNELLTNPDADFSQVMRMPGFEFARQQGEQGVSNYLARKGMGRSGRAMEEISRYNQDYATGQFGNYLNRLTGMANYGVGGINQSAAAGGRMANALTGIYGRQANRAMTVGQNYNNAFQGGMANYLLQRQLRPSPYSGGGVGDVWGGGI